MSDLTDRLLARTYYANFRIKVDPLCAEAAAEIERRDAEIETLRRRLTDALPHLRKVECAMCDGSGVIVRGDTDEDSYEETCLACEPLVLLISHIEQDLPKSVAGAPTEKDDGIAF